MSFVLPIDPSFVMGAGLLAAGFSATMVGVLLGAGGGLIAIPILHFIFMQMGLDGNTAMILTAGTAALATTLSTPRVLWIYRRAGFLDIPLAKRLVVPAITGCLFAHGVGMTGSGPLMQTTFAVIVSLLGLYMAFGSERHYLTDGVPGNEIMIPFALGLGIVAAMMGVSGTVICVPFLIACRVPLRRAIGTSATLALGVGIVSFACYALRAPVPAIDALPYTIGSVHILAALLFFAASQVGAPVGLWLQKKLPGSVLRRLFAGILCLSALRFSWLVYIS